MKPTPGPWTVTAIRGGYLIESATGRVVRGAGGVKTEADANLIASAPGLAEALRECLTALKVAMNVIYHAGLSESFIAECEARGVRDGIGVRAQAALSAAGKGE